MRKIWLLLGVTLLGAMLALGAIACGDDDKKDDNGGTTPDAATATEAAGQPTEADATQPASDTPEPGAEIAPITMNEVDGSGVTGSATMTETATGGTDVEVTIDGSLEEGSHQSHLHHGTCATQPGEIHTTLTSVEAGADGSGSASSTIETADNPDNPPFSHWLAREHYLAVHKLDGTLVSCGDVVAAS